MSLSSNNKAQTFDSGHYFIHLILFQKKISNSLVIWCVRSGKLESVRVYKCKLRIFCKDSGYMGKGIKLLCRVGKSVKGNL